MRHDMEAQNSPQAQPEADRPRRDAAVTPVPLSPEDASRVAGSEGPSHEPNDGRNDEPNRGPRISAEQKIPAEQGVSAEQGISAEQGVSAEQRISAEQWRAGAWPRCEAGWPVWPPPLGIENGSDSSGASNPAVDSDVTGSVIAPTGRRAEQPADELPLWDWSQRLRELLHSSHWGSYQSPIREEWSRSLAARLGVPHARATSSGTAAVELALRAAGVGVGDAVIVAGYDFPGNFRTIELLGARPMLVDVLEDSPTIDPACLESLPESVTGTVRAVIISHLHGHLADARSVLEICRARGWVLIEDVCQAIGAGWRIGPVGSETEAAPEKRGGPGKRTYHTTAAGQVGDIATLSFGGSKLMTAGNGGALLTSSPRWRAKLDAILDRPGDTFPMSPMQCAVLIPQLHTLDQLNRLRAARFRQLQSLDWSASDCQTLANLPADVVAAPYKFPLLAQSPSHRDEALARLATIGLPAGPGFRGMHRTSRRRSSHPVPLPHTARLSESLIVIDHRALLSADVVDRILGCGVARPGSLQKK